MPQKKNPDVLELIRGRAARVVGGLTTLLVLVKGLPLAYNRDLQEDKEPLFDAFDTVEACLDLAAVVVDGAKLRADRIAERLDEGYPRRDDPDGMPDPARRSPAHGARGHRPPGRPLRSRGSSAWPTSPTTSFAEAHPRPRPRGDGDPRRRQRRSRRSGRMARRRPAEVEKQLERMEEAALVRFAPGGRRCCSFFNPVWLMSAYW